MLPIQTFSSEGFYSFTPNQPLPLYIKGIREQRENKFDKLMTQINKMTMKLTGNSEIIDALGFQKNRYKSLMNQMRHLTNKVQKSDKDQSFLMLNNPKSVNPSPNKMMQSFEIQRGQSNNSKIMKNEVKKRKHQSNRGSISFQQGNHKKANEDLISKDILKPMKPVKLNPNLLNNTKDKITKHAKTTKHGSNLELFTNQKPSLQEKKKRKIKRHFISDVTQLDRSRSRKSQEQNLSFDKHSNQNQTQSFNKTIEIKQEDLTERNNCTSNQEIVRRSQKFNCSSEKNKLLNSQEVRFKLDEESKEQNTTQYKTSQQHLSPFDRNKTLNMQSSLSREIIKSSDLNEDLSDVQDAEVIIQQQITPNHFDNPQQQSSQQLNNNSHQLIQKFKRSQTTQRPRNAYEAPPRQRKFVIVDIDDYLKMRVIRPESSNKKKEHKGNSSQRKSDKGSKKSRNSQQNSASRDKTAQYEVQYANEEDSDRILAKKKVKRINETSQSKFRSPHKKDQYNSSSNLRLSKTFKSRIIKDISSSKINLNKKISEKFGIENPNLIKSFKTLKSIDQRGQKDFKIRENSQILQKAKNSISQLENEFKKKKTLAKQKSRQQSRANSTTPEIRIDHNIQKENNMSLKLLIDFDEKERMQNPNEVAKDIEIKARSQYSIKVRQKSKDLYNNYWGKSGSKERKEAK